MFEIDFRHGEGKRGVPPFTSNAEIVAALLKTSRLRYFRGALERNDYHLLNFQEALNQNGILATRMEPENV